MVRETKGLGEFDEGRDKKARRAIETCEATKMGRPSNREEALAALRASLAKGKIIVGAGAGKWEPRDAPIFLLSPLLGPRLGRATYPCLKFFEDDKTDEKTIIITAVKPCIVLTTVYTNRHRSLSQVR